MKLVALMFSALVVLLFACGSPPANAPPQDPARETARSVVLVVAEAVHAADSACAAVAITRRDPELAEKCVVAYKLARGATVAAGESIDAWDAGSRGAIACAVVKAGNALATMVDAIRSGGATVPPVIVDALALVPVLSGVCK